MLIDASICYWFCYRSGGIKLLVDSWGYYWPSTTWGTAWFKIMAYLELEPTPIYWIVWRWRASFLNYSYSFAILFSIYGSNFIIALDELINGAFAGWDILDMRYWDIFDIDDIFFISCLLVPLATDLLSMSVFLSS